MIRSKDVRALRFRFPGELPPRVTFVVNTSIAPPLSSRRLELSEVATSWAASPHEGSLATWEVRVTVPIL